MAKRKRSGKRICYTVKGKRVCRTVGRKRKRR